MAKDGIGLSRIHGTSIRERDRFFESLDRSMAPDEVDQAGPAKRLRSSDAKRSEAKTPERKPKAQPKVEPKVEASIDSLKPTEIPSPTKPKSKTSKKAPAPTSELFESLKFFFVPNRAKSNVLKVKIAKFQEHGAAVADKLDGSVTHVLVDPSWTLQMALTYLEPNSIPDGTETVLNTWPSSCITKKKLLDVAQFRVPEASSEDGEDVQTETAPARASSPKAQDELDEIIKHNKLGDAAMGMMSDEDDAVLTDSGSPPAVKRRKANWNAFQCMKPDVGVEVSNPNMPAIQVLSMMLNLYETEGVEDFKIQAYRRAISTLKRQTVPIKTAAQARRLPGIGGRLADKIEEAWTTGTLQKIDFTKSEGKVAVLGLFQGIYGVGPKTAMKWYTAGDRTLDDISKRTDLSENQRISLEHYDDLNVRISRDIVSKHFEVVRKAVAGIDPKIEATCMGSYRRGQPDCGDIDIILTKPGVDKNELRIVLWKLLDKLFDTGFVKYSFGGNEANTMRWLGATALPDGIWRRMDILLVPWSEQGGALIYYTGNDLFNRSIRLLASKKGYNLNEKGLFLAKTDKSKTEGPLVEGASERKIFEILGVPYRAPDRRNIG